METAWYHILLVDYTYNFKPETEYNHNVLFDLEQFFLFNTHTSWRVTGHVSEDYRFFHRILNDLEVDHGIGIESLLASNGRNYWTAAMKSFWYQFEHINDEVERRGVQLRNEFLEYLDTIPVPFVL